MNKTMGPGNFNITTTIVILSVWWTKPCGQEILILVLLWCCMMNKPLWPGNFNTTCLASSWNALFCSLGTRAGNHCRGLSEFQIWSYREVTIPNLKAQTTNKFQFERPNSATLGLDPRVTTNYNWLCNSGPRSQGYNQLQPTLQPRARGSQLVTTNSLTPGPTKGYN